MLRKSFAEFISFTALLVTKTAVTSENMTTNEIMIPLTATTVKELGVVMYTMYDTIVNRLSRITPVQSI